MIIHFVCRGNTYRSRLAETYLNSKKLPNIKAISSGIGADHNISGPISWYAQRIIQNEHLVSFEKPAWQKTTQELLNQGNFTVFMNSDIYDFCTSNFSFKNENFETWDIKDLDLHQNTEEERIKISEKTFEEIKKRVDDLIETKKPQ
ncbi:MAG TPA: hypothetical protein VES68_02950 [Candidatus Sulfotelmatobacter sp.]|nr:hypothetical protein [Candidatus Sulfotelmatobacter sp.]